MANMIKVFREWFPPHVSGVYCIQNIATSLLQREQFWLDEILTKYNTSPTAGTRTGVRNTLVTNERISAAIRAKWADPVFRAAAKAGMKGAKKRARHVKH